MRNKTAYVMTVCLALAAAPVQAAPAPASPEDIAFFIGRWATGPAPVEGYETLGASAPDCSRAVRIETGPTGGIVRTARLRDGQERAVAFRVMRFANDHPWWPVDGGPGPIARRVGADRFDLAPTAMGRADWARAMRHYRCPADAGGDITPPPDGPPHRE